MSDQIALNELPQEGGPDYFRALVRNCIATYRKLPNDALCLDYNKVSGRLRSMILDDDEYKKETRNIYAQQQLEAISEIDYLARLASNSNDEDEDNDPRSRGKNKKASGADKDMLNMRFKAAQMKRELIAAMNEDAVSERQVLPMLYVAVTAEEFARFDTVEDHTGTDDACLDELDDHKELLPEGVSGSVQTHGHNRQQEVDDFYDIDLNTGEVIER